MLYRIYYGEISKTRKENWDNGETNPYAVLEWTKNISIYDWVAFLGTARKYFADEIQIDWGSFAWKAKMQDILNLKRDLYANVEGEKELKADTEYGVVFIEES